MKTLLQIIDTSGEPDVISERIIKMESKEKKSMLKFGMNASCEQLVVQCMKNNWFRPMTSDQILEYINRMTAKNYKLNNISNALSSLKRDNLIKCIRTNKKIFNNTFLIEYILKN